MFSRPECDASIGLEPLQVAGDPGEACGPLRFATKAGHETVDSHFGRQAVLLVDHQRAARITLKRVLFFKDN
jgi:hypothetical protein